MSADVREARRAGVAGMSGEAQTGRVLVSSYHYLEGPAIAVCALGVIVLICRWVFAPSGSTPPGPKPPVQRGDFGLLEPVTVVRTLDDAHMLRAILREAGIRGTVADSAGGFAVLVFRDDARRARELVRA